MLRIIGLPKLGSPFLYCDNFFKVHLVIIVLSYGKNGDSTSDVKQNEGSAIDWFGWFSCD